MTFRILVALFLTTVPAMAHSGHVAPVDGHSHTILDLVMMGAGSAIVVVVLVLVAARWLARRDG